MEYDIGDRLGADDRHGSFDRRRRRLPSLHAAEVGDRRDAAGERRGRSGRVVVGPVVAEMHVRVDAARQDKQAASVDLLGVGVTGNKTGPDLRDRRADNADVRQASADRGDDLTAAYESLGFLLGGGNDRGRAERADNHQISQPMHDAPSGVLLARSTSSPTLVTTPPAPRPGRDESRLREP